jgi:hypothetical protein
MVRALLPIALVVGVAFAPFCAQAESPLSLNPRTSAQSSIIWSASRA